jgi:uncharacterized protein
MEDERLQGLIDILREMESAVLACSGGVDSVFLMKALKLSGIRALAVTARSETAPEGDMRDASRMASEIGVEHRFIETRELEREGFAQNPPDRCFHCKDELFGRLVEIARGESFASVIDGSNLDDARDYRPGRRAALRHGVRSPLAEAGFTKSDVRRGSKALGLCTWDKPSSPCLSSRFPYGRRITREGLRRVAEAEGFLRGLGFAELRVRDHGDTARVEVPEAEMGGVLEIRRELVQRLTALGYKFVCLDLEGLESGKMNRLLR